MNMTMCCNLSNIALKFEITTLRCVVLLQYTDVYGILTPHCVVKLLLIHAKYFTMYSNLSFSIHIEIHYGKTV